MKNTKYKLYLDLDGVIADFNGRVSELYKPASGEEYAKSKMWGAIKRYNDEVQPFFATLDKMPGADQLVDFVTKNFENVKFLSASGSTPKNAPEQKREWANENYPGIECIVVGSSTQKAVYANPNAILIDDREKSIDPWRRAGGYGILYKNNAQAINELKKVL